MKEPAPTPNCRWDQLLRNCKSHRAEVRNGITAPFSRVNLVNTPHGYQVLALGSIYPNANQTVISAHLQHLNAKSLGNITLHSVFDIENHKASTPNQEFTLMLERQRLSQVTGVTDYYADITNGNVLLTTGDKLYRLCPDDGGGFITTASAINGQNAENFITEARICPEYPTYYSYVVDRQLHVENQKGIIYKSPREPHVTNGTASFIEQEELDRFEASWWSPKGKRLLYERVDDYEVKTLGFACPGKDETSPMKYPLAGTKNSKCSLRVIVIDEKENITDAGMRSPLQEYFPWIEYIGRAGFMNDGRTVWVQAFDRHQQRTALIVVPETEFGLSSSGEQKVLKPTIVYEDTNKFWINTVNTIIPLDRDADQPETEIKFIYAQERVNHCQLYLVGVEFDHDNDSRRFSWREITPNHFSVCKSTQAVVDLESKFVYYVAAPNHCTEWAVCVSNYEDRKPGYKQLTPSNCSIKGERAFHRISLIPNFGFACFITAYNQPPVCQFFSFHNGPESAELTGTITPFSLVQETKPTVPKDPNDLPQYFRYTSRNSGVEHVGMVLMPPGHDPTKKYPVLHYVYAGPGIQLVKNDYTCWASYQKYSKAGFAVVVVDGRGSANRGLFFEAPIQENLGGPEVEDQVEGLQELARLMEGRLDLDRVVVHGWSYGGFMSLQMLAHYPDVYRGAIAGGAVVKWQFYDTAYTERYLGYPVGDSYEACSFTNAVGKLPDEPGRLLIVHGVLDENVHLRHTEALIEALLKEGKPYQLQIFPSERHGIRSPEGANHLDATMLHFIQTVLRSPRPEDTLV